MILTLLIKGLIAIVGVILGIIPFLISAIVFAVSRGTVVFPPYVTQLPFGIDAVLSSGMDYVRFLATIIPPIGIFMQYFMYAIIWTVAIKAVQMVPIIRGWFQKNK